MPIHKSGNTDGTLGFDGDDPISEKTLVVDLLPTNTLPASRLLEVLSQSIQAVGQAARLTIDNPSLDPNARSALDALIKSVEDLASLAEGQGYEVDNLRKIVAAQTHRIQMAAELLHEMEAAALKDPLTSAWNRRALGALGPRVFEKMKREGKPFSMILFDLDLFKIVNDEISHDAGDRVLIEFVSRVGKLSRLSDFFFRVGGEEFLLIVPETDASGAATLAERIRKHMEDRPIEYETCGKVYTIKQTVSAGATEAHYGIDSSHVEIQSRVDITQKKAKETRNTVVKSSFHGGGLEFMVCSPSGRLTYTPEEAQGRYLAANGNGNGKGNGKISVAEEEG